MLLCIQLEVFLSESEDANDYSFAGALLQGEGSPILTAAKEA
jgi:hypothetical protein